MRKTLLIGLTLVFTSHGLTSWAQPMKRTFEYKGETLEYVELNKVENPKALLVLFDGGRGLAMNIPNETKIPEEAVKSGLLTIGINQSKFHLEKEDYVRIASTVKYVMKKHDLDQCFYGGFSLGGFTAVRLAEMTVEYKDKKIIPAAIFAVDPPLDYVDFHAYCLRELSRSCTDEKISELGKGEANYILGYYRNNFGSIEDHLSEYEAASCFSASRPDGGNAKYLTDIPVHLFHEIDVNWYAKERCRDLRDANGNIGSQLLVYLLNAGNESSRATITPNKGYRGDGRRHPHSWSIAEPAAILPWLESFIED